MSIFFFLMWMSMVPVIMKYCTNNECETIVDATGYETILLAM
ncbi:MAG TPA: hypothetical protein PK544_09070 [Spirochaetota bacterium]|nr:hypothetical protein [Spirochaetota bacterium]